MAEQGETQGNPARELQMNKMNYCMHKDDLVIGLGRPIYDPCQSNKRKYAYPSVITTMKPMNEYVRRFLALQNFMTEDIDDMISMKNEFVKYIRDETKTKVDAAKCALIETQLKNSLELYMVGVSLGLAYAHPHSGDTVASVMVGGLKTVLNGDFVVHTNDLLMFYWDDELSLFEEDGRRRDRKIFLDSADPSKRDENQIWNWVHELKLNGFGTVTTSALSTHDKERKAFHEKGNGTYASQASNNSPSGKVCVAKIKPYLESKHKDSFGKQVFPLDKNRIFAKALSNAQKYEMLDIMLSRQSI
jgi:hypothetical protein